MRGAATHGSPQGGSGSAPSAPAAGEERPHLVAEEIRSRAQLPPQLPLRLSPVADAALSASPTAPPARRPRECGRSGGPGVAGAAVGHGGGRGSPTALVVLRLSGGPRPFGPASFAVCPFGFLPVSYWVLPLIPIACRSCLYLQGVGPSSLPYGAVWLAGCLGGAQPEARGQDTGHSHHNPGAVQTSGLSSAGGPGSPLSTQTAREARVFSPAAAGPG